MFAQEGLKLVTSDPFVAENPNVGVSSRTFAQTAPGAKVLARPGRWAADSGITVPDLIDRTDIADLWRRLGGGALRRGRGRAFWRNGKSERAVSIVENRGVWYDQGARRGGGKLDLIQTVTGCDRRGAMDWLAAYHGISLGRQTEEQRRARQRRRAAAEQQARAAVGWRDGLITYLRHARRRTWSDCNALDRFATEQGPESESSWEATAEAVRRRRVADAIDAYLDTVTAMPFEDLRTLWHRIEGGASA